MDSIEFAMVTVKQRRFKKKGCPDRRIVFYVCDVCGKEHGNRTRANDCEGSHR